MTRLRSRQMADYLRADKSEPPDADVVALIQPEPDTTLSDAEAERIGWGIKWASIVIAVGIAAAGMYRVGQILGALP